MKKSFIITSLFLFASLAIKAQDIKKPQPDSLIKVIPFGEGRYSSYLYTIGGKLQTREDVLVKLMAYAPSAGEVQLARNNITWTWISFGAFTASSFGSIIEFKNNNKDAGIRAAIVNGQATFIYQKHSLTGAYIFTGAATGFLFATIFHFAKASLHSQRALKKYNQQFE